MVSLCLCAPAYLGHLIFRNSLGAHSWVRQKLGIAMEGESTGAPSHLVPLKFTAAVYLPSNYFPFTDQVWGAIDIIPSPSTDFPDWRNACTINTATTTILAVPREQDQTRLYVEVGQESHLIDTSTGRVNPEGLDKERLLEVRLFLQGFAD